MDLETACAVIGEKTVIEIAKRLIHARNKHEDNGGGLGLAGSVLAIEDEVKEVVESFCKGDGRVADECLDVIATAVRCYNGEYE